MELLGGYCDSDSEKQVASGPEAKVPTSPSLPSTSTSNISELSRCTEVKWGGIGRDNTNAPVGGVEEDWEEYGYSSSSSYHASSSHTSATSTPPSSPGTKARNANEGDEVEEAVRAPAAALCSILCSINSLKWGNPEEETPTMSTVDLIKEANFYLTQYNSTLLREKLVTENTKKRKRYEKRVTLSNTTPLVETNKKAAIESNKNQNRALVVSQLQDEETATSSNENEGSGDIDIKRQEIITCKCAIEAVLMKCSRVVSQQQTKPAQIRDVLNVVVLYRRIAPLLHIGQRNVQSWFSQVKFKSQLSTTEQKKLYEFYTADIMAEGILAQYVPYIQCDGGILPQHFCAGMTLQCVQQIMKH